MLKGKGSNVVRSIIAVVITALIFAFSHSSIRYFDVTDLLANIPIFMLGLTVTALYWKTDNILCPILVHACINSFGSLG